MVIKKIITSCLPFCSEDSQHYSVKNLVHCSAIWPTAPFTAWSIAQSTTWSVVRSAAQSEIEGFAVRNDESVEMLDPPPSNSSIQNWWIFSKMMICYPIHGPLKLTYVYWSDGSDWYSTVENPNLKSVLGLAKNFRLWLTASRARPPAEIMYYSGRADGQIFIFFSSVTPNQILPNFL